MFQDHNRGQEENSQRFRNLMWNPRIKRGPTTQTQVIPRRRNTRRRNKRKRVKKPIPLQLYKEYDFENEISSEEEREIKSLEIDLSEFLEEKSTPKVNRIKTTQTDKFKELSEYTTYIPAKTGIDRHVQVGPDLFNFQKEVRPVVEVLVGKTLEQSLLEVLHEEEISNLKDKQANILQKQENERRDIERMEEAEKKEYERKADLERRKKKRKKEVMRTKEKVVSHHLAGKLVSDIREKVLKQLQEDGYFKDEVERSIQSQFLPWLNDCVHSEIKRRNPKVDSLLYKM